MHGLGVRVLGRDGGSILGRFIMLEHSLDTRYVSCCATVAKISVPKSSAQAQGQRENILIVRTGSR